VISKILSKIFLAADVSDNSPYNTLVLIHRAWKELQFPFRILHKSPYAFLLVVHQNGHRHYFLYTYLYISFCLGLYMHLVYKIIDWTIVENY
jgi:hypothetical protein